MRKFLFVGRHNNDIDSMAPVAAKLAAESDNEVDYFISNPEIRSAEDYRLKYLRNHRNVAIHDVWELLPARALANISKQLWLKLDSRSGPLHKVPEIVSTELMRRYAWEQSLVQWLDRIRPDLVAFDWCDPYAPRPKHRAPYGLAGIADWAKEHRKPIVALPHGLLLFDLETKTSRDYLDAFTAVFVESSRHRKLLTAERSDPDRVIVSGSPRYDPEWIDVVSRLQPAPVIKASSALRLVFFATKTVYDYDFAKLLAWLEQLATYPSIQLTVQPHPRNQKPRAFAKIRHLRNVSIDTSTPAPVLIRSADVVSTLVSSVVVEAAYLGKPILYPKFLHNAVTRFEEKGACLKLNSSHETAGALEKLAAGWRPAQDAVERFLDEDVYGNQDRNVIARLSATLRKLAAAS